MDDVTWLQAKEAVNRVVLNSIRKRSTSIVSDEFDYVKIGNNNLPSCIKDAMVILFMDRRTDDEDCEIIRNAWDQLQRPSKGYIGTGQNKTTSGS